MTSDKLPTLAFRSISVIVNTPAVVVAVTSQLYSLGFSVRLGGAHSIMSHPHNQGSPCGLAWDAITSQLYSLGFSIWWIGSVCDVQQMVCYSHLAHLRILIWTPPASVPLPRKPPIEIGISAHLIIFPWRTTLV